MATISFAGATDSQITVNIGHDGSVVDNFEIRRSPGGVLASSGTFTATTTHGPTQRTATDLSPGTLYSFTVNYYRGSTFVHSASGSWSTKEPPPPSKPGTTSITGFGYGNPDQRAPTTVTANWSSATGATIYDYYVSELGISNSTASTSVSFFVSAGGTYTFTVSPRNSAGSGTGDSKSFTLHSLRPLNFDWTHPKTPGQTIVVSALEWNSFFNTINGFRGYKLQSRYDFSSASTGHDITADHINEARNAIHSMNPLVTIPDYCFPKTTDVSAYYFTRLRDSLNSVN